MQRIKLVTGLGNKDLNKVYDLVLIWMKAGADIFDMAPSVLFDVQKKAESDGFDLNNYEFCVSIPIKGDIHGKKARIDKNICTKCGVCAEMCSEKAIVNFEADEKRCIGCSHCAKACKTGAITMHDDINNDFENLLNKNVKLDTAEIHIAVEDADKIYKDFEKYIDRIAKFEEKTGKKIKISVCLNREYFSNKSAKEILENLYKLKGGREFVVQSDGLSMNLGKEELASTIETVAFSLFVKKLGYDVILSGGTNSYTANLAHKAGLNCPIAYGSFARKMTENLKFEEAVIKAKEFIKKTKEEFND